MALSGTLLRFRTWGAACALLGVRPVGDPFLVLMGQFATQGGLSRCSSRRHVASAGHPRLAMAAIHACAAFGAICGSSVATAATVTQAALPRWCRNYSGRLATATLAAGGTLGILIRIGRARRLCDLTEQKIAKPFARDDPRHHRDDRLPDHDRLVVRHLSRTRDATPRSGAPHHCAGSAGRRDLLSCSAASTAVSSRRPRARGRRRSTFVAGIATRELDIAGMKRAFLATAETSGMIFMIFVGADMLNSALALSQMPAQLAQTVSSLGLPPLVVMVCVLVFYIVLGCVMVRPLDEADDGPRAVPVGHGARSLRPQPTEGDLSGILVDGRRDRLDRATRRLNVYVVNGLAKDVPMSETRGVMPFPPRYVRVTLLVPFPAISLWLVRLMG
jgi:hypothetical protein